MYLFTFFADWLIDWLIFEEFEEKCPPEDQLASPRSVDVAETENLSYYSTMQVLKYYYHYKVGVHIQWLVESTST